MGDPTRLRILLALQEAPQNVGELCVLLKMPQPSVSHHLSILRMASLVRNQRQGKEIFYSLTQPRLTASRKLVKSLMKTLGC